MTDFKFDPIVPFHIFIFHKMRTPESSNKSSGWAKKTMAVTAIVGAAAWVGAEPVANHIIGEQTDTAPTEPQKPEPKPAKRQNVDIAIGFDTTRSAIMKELPAVAEATKGFLEETKILADGDKVTVCTFAEEANCRSYKIPAERQALLDSVGKIKPEAPRDNMQTHVHHSINSIAQQVRGENGLVLAWTDGIEDQKGQKNALPSAHPPVTIVVPKEGYLTSAESVKLELGSKGVDVVLAQNGGDFGRLLEKFTGKLERDARTKAEAEVAALYQQQMKEHTGKMTAYEAEKKAYAEKHAAAKEKIETVKTSIKITAGALMALAASALGTLLYMRNRPKLKGWILDNRNEYAEIYRIPAETKEISLSRVSRNLPGSITIKPTSNGIYAGNERLRNGFKLDENIFWFDKEPDEETINRICKKNDI